MAGFPEIRLMHSSPRGPVPFDKDGLNAVLPVTRPSGNSTAQSPITYRTYLEAVKLFILDHWPEVLEIVSESGLDETQIQRLDIIAEKHGSDYHPARVRLHAREGSRSFVVNAAVTERGKQRLSNDFRLLDSLRGRFKRCFVPAVYFLGGIDVEHEAGHLVQAQLFLGEWLERHWEFHVSTHNGTPAMVVWDLEDGYSPLSERDAEEVYRQAAFILTYYYNVESREEIFPWHHAAGDFVAAGTGKSLQVRLITVRQYASRWILREDSSLDTIKALLSFFVNLTMRMRLDRLDGVGDIVWAGQHCLNGTINGFFDALRAKVAESAQDVRVLTEFLGVLKGASPQELAEIFQAVVDSYDQDAPDVPVILDNLLDHILLVYRLAQEIPESFIHPGN